MNPGKENMDMLCDAADGKGKLILIVDDDKMILDMVSEALHIFGYNVIEAENGFSAIDILRKVCDRNPEESDPDVVNFRAKSPWSMPDLVVLDVNMPDMRGGELLEKMKEIEPGLKVLLSTGLSINGEVMDIMKRGCSGFIQKPFTITELNEKIKLILRRP